MSKPFCPRFFHFFILFIMYPLEQRIIELEKQLKRQRIFSIIGLFLLFTWLGLTAATDGSFLDVKPVVKTERLEIVNEAGKTVLRLEALESAGGLTLLNNDMQEVLFLGSDSKGRGGLLELSNNEGKNLLQMRSNEIGGALKIFNDKKQNVLFLGESIQDDGNGYISIAQSGKGAVILDAKMQKVFVAHPTSKTGYVQFPN